MRFKWHETSLIELIILLATLILISFRYHDTLDQLHLEWFTQGLGLGFLWCLHHNLFLLLFSYLLIAGKLMYQWFVVILSSLHWLQKQFSVEVIIMLNDRIQKHIICKDPIRLQLIPVDVIKCD